VISSAITYELSISVIQMEVAGQLVCGWLAIEPAIRVALLVREKSNRHVLSLESGVTGSAKPG